jgi:phosphate-selective porin OprO and OprP
MLIRSALVIAVVIAGTAPAQQGGAQSREEELEKLVRELAQEVRELRQRLDRVEGGTAPPAAEARIQQLEQTVEEIKKEQPSQEELELFRKWTSESLTLRPFWKDGLQFESNDGSVKMKIGGRIHLDTAFFAEDGSIERRFGDFEDGVDFRRARVSIEGEFRENMNFKAQYDFAGGDADFKDVYVGFKKVPYVGNLRVGQFKEPFSLEQLTSSNYITFMERSLADTFAPARNVGLMFHDTYLDQRMTGAIGVFRPTDDFGTGSGDHQYSITGRITGLPWYEDGGKKLLHVGAAYSYQNYEDPIRYRARPESGQAPRIVDTRDFQANHGQLLGLEAALVHGPFSIQSELIHACINGESAFVGDPNFWGGYIQASYFLTGEHRPYSKGSGTFGRVRPLRNFREDGGWGAWEVAGRVSHIDLNDGNIRGGRLNDFTLGLNWYLNPSVRTMWNYVYSDSSDGGDVSIYQARLQIAF